MRAKDSTAITITLPAALDEALEVLAERKHCGNKSAAIREVLYKEAGLPSGGINVKEGSETIAIANSEKRAVKYGRRKGKKR